MKIVAVLATLSAPSRHFTSANFPPIRQQSLGANNIISALSRQAFSSSILTLIQQVKSNEKEKNTRHGLHLH